MLANRRAAKGGEARRDAAWRNKEVENVDRMVLVGCTLDCVFGVGFVLRRRRTASVLVVKERETKSNSGKIQRHFPVSAECY